MFASLARGQVRRCRHLLPRQAARQPDIRPRPRRVWPIPAAALASLGGRASPRAQTFGIERETGLVGTLALPVKPRFTERQKWLARLGKSCEKELGLDFHPMSDP